MYAPNTITFKIKDLNQKYHFYDLSRALFEHNAPFIVCTSQTIIKPFQA